MIEDIPHCEVVKPHESLLGLQQIQDQMPIEDDLYDLAELFKVFGDSTRVKILYALYEKELCVCDLATVLNMTISAISHQLRILKNAGLVKYRREKKEVIYALDDEHVHDILGLGMEHIKEER